MPLQGRADFAGAAACCAARPINPNCKAAMVFAAAEAAT
jgi:hypothetical protein